MTEPAIIIVLLGILLLGSWLLVRYYRRRRILATVAYRMQFRVSAHLDYNLPGSLAGLYCMQRGYNRRACHVIRGRSGDLECTAFDYRYETGLGSGRSNHHASVVIWKGKRALPSIVALRENSFYPIGIFSPFVSLSTRSPDFNQLFTVYSDQPEKALEFLTDDLMRLLLHCRYANWEFHDRYIVLFADHPLPAIQLHRLIRRGLQTAELLSDTAIKPT